MKNMEQSDELDNNPTVKQASENNESTSMADVVTDQSGSPTMESEITSGTNLKSEPINVQENKSNGMASSPDNIENVSGQPNPLTQTIDNSFNGTTISEDLTKLEPPQLENEISCESNLEKEVLNDKENDQQIQNSVVISVGNETPANNSTHIESEPKTPTEIQAVFQTSTPITKEVINSNNPQTVDFVPRPDSSAQISMDERLEKETHGSGHSSETSSVGSTNGAAYINHTRKVDVQEFPISDSNINAPIVGYEVMEERSRFTVFKIRVANAATEENWFVFRRYTDFSRLNKQLRKLFPGLRFGLPPKRWFGDNFDQEFLEDRMLGLQAYVSNIVCNSQTCNCTPVREFFCLDEPPGTPDTLEESRARCDSLEEQVYTLQQVVREKQAEIELMRAELAMVKAQQSVLVKSLSIPGSLGSELNASSATQLCSELTQDQTPPTTTENGSGDKEVSSTEVASEGGGDSTSDIQHI